MTIKHSFTSAVADDPTAAAAGEVLPSHWNAAHVDANGNPVTVRTLLTANTNFYVATTGSDSNSGSSTSPWATLQHAMNFIAANFDGAGFVALINVGAGTFAGLNVVDYVGFRQFEFIGAGSGSTTIIDGPNDGTLNFGECISSSATNSSYWYFNKMKFQNHGVNDCEVFTIYQGGNLTVGLTPSQGFVFDLIIDLTFMNGKSSFNSPDSSTTVFDILGIGNISHFPMTVIGGGATIGTFFYAEGVPPSRFSSGGNNTISGNFTCSRQFTQVINATSMNTGGSATFFTAGVGTVTGKRFDVNTSGAIFAFAGPGQLGPNFFPGTIVGTVDDDVSQYDGLYGSEYPQAFTSLPASPVKSEEFTINDGLAAHCADGSCTTFGTHVTAGGGALNLKIRWNGSNWTLMGV